MNPFRRSWAYFSGFLTSAIKSFKKPQHLAESPFRIPWQRVETVESWSGTGDRNESLGNATWFPPEVGDVGVSDEGADAWSGR